MSDKNIQNAADHYAELLRSINGVALKKAEKDERSNTYDIIFSYKDDITMAIFLDYDDAPFVRFVLPNFFDITEGVRRRAYERACETSRVAKCVKVFLNQDEDDSIATVEFLDGSIEEGDGRGMTGTQLERYLDMLLSAASTFSSKMS